MDNKGFTYSGILINLIIAGFLLPIVVSSLRLLVMIDFDKIDLQNEIGIIQLRRDLLYANELNVDLNEIDFFYKGQNNSLVFNNNHLYRTPGTVIYLENIDYVAFEENYNNIYLIYYKDEKEYRRIIY